MSEMVTYFKKVLFHEDLARSTVGIAHNLDALLCSAHLLTAEVIALYDTAVGGSVASEDAADASCRLGSMVEQGNLLTGIKAR